MHTTTAVQLNIYSFCISHEASPSPFTKPDLPLGVKATVGMQRDQTPVTYFHLCTHKHKQLLTASVFESVDGVGQEADTAQETCALLFVDLLVVPYTDGD